VLLWHENKGLLKALYLEHLLLLAHQTAATNVKMVVRAQTAILTLSVQSWQI